MQLELLNEVVMEKQVSAAALPRQRALTTPPLVVLLLYLQNAQLSFKPALCLRGGGGRRGRTAARSEVLPASCDTAGPSNIYSTKRLTRRDAPLRADEGQISKTPSKDDVRSASFDSNPPPPSDAAECSSQILGNGIILGRGGKVESHLQTLVRTAKETLVCVKQVEKVLNQEAEREFVLPGEEVHP